MSSEEGVDEQPHYSPHTSRSFSQEPAHSSHSSHGSHGHTYQDIPSSPSSRRDDGGNRVSTLEHRHQQLNSLFGIKPFKSHISRRRVDERSPQLREMYEDNKTFTSIPGMRISSEESEQYK